MATVGGVTRIVAGAAGGRRLVVPRRGTRPTSERVREALFSALEAGPGLVGARVMDLYAGSGALGLEALSRGASHALLVESDRQAATTLRRNVAALGLPGAEVRQQKVAAVLAERTPCQAIEPAPEPYDIVLADPPYQVTGEVLVGVLTALAAWTAPGAVVVVERAGRDGEPPWPRPYRALRSKSYGDTAVHWARHEP